MNDAHLHMVVNHFPIIGTIFGLAILIASMIWKNTTLRNTSYVIFITAAIFAFASMFTGEGAEEITEGLQGVTHEIIHEHEELAEKLAVLLYVLGFVSILGLITTAKNHAKAKLVSFLALFIAIVGVILAKSVGTSGGEIRHTEIRESTANSELTAPISQKEVEEKD